MRRFLLTLTGTIAGLVALLSFKSHSPASSAAGPAGGAGTSVSTSGLSGAGPVSGSGGSTGNGTAGSAGGTGTTRTVTGSAMSTPYGPMQVQVSLAGRKVTAVRVLQQTNSGQESQQIDANAIPQLTRETLTAQSANISAVSGASYTSGGYIKSLQSALDLAKA